MNGFGKVDVLTKYASQFEERINHVDRLFKLEDGIRCKNGINTYSTICEQIHKLKVIVTKMQVILEDEKRNTEKFQEQLNQLKLLNEKISHMVLFSLQHSSKEDSSRILSTSTKENAQDASKENAPERVKAQSKRKMGVPSLNPISEDDFSKVPKYMKGHLSLEQLNSGITDINLILSKKYDIFNRRRKDLSLKDEKLRGVYMEQGKDLKGTCYSTFFVDDDIQRFSSMLKLKHKTKDNIFLILRHLGRMKEMHKGKLKRYCIVSA